MFSVRFEGGAELAATLNALPSALSTRVLREVLKDVAEPMRERMSQLAPREPGAPDLADNIWISNASMLGSTEGGRWRRAEEGEVSVAVGPTKGFFYGLYQEYGTIRHGAQPFMRPAFDSEAPRAVPEIAERLWVVLASHGVHRPMRTSIGPISGGTGAGPAGGPRLPGSGSLL